jgi:hypothetical protein
MLCHLGLEYMAFSHYHLLQDLIQRFHCIGFSSMLGELVLQNVGVIH